MIGYICHHFPGITQTFVLNEVNALTELGVDLVVISFRRSKKNLALKMHDGRKYPIIYLHSLKSPNFYLGVIKGFCLNPMKALSSLVNITIGKFEAINSFKERLFALFAYLRGLYIGSFAADYQIHHFHAAFADHQATAALVASEITGRPFSFRCHGDFNTQLLFEKVMKSKWIATCCMADKQHLLNRTEEKFKKKIIVNYLGIESSNIVSGHQASPTIDILSVGSLIKKKGHRYLIEALALIKQKGYEFKTVIIGEGEEQTELRKLILGKNLTNDVILKPFTSNRMVMSEMSKCKIFCLPCITTKEGDHDGIPFVLMEAMSLGKTCISTNVWGIPEMISHNENGVIVPEKNIEILVIELIRLLSDSSLREKLGRSAKQTILQRFDLSNNAAFLATLFQQQ